MTLIEMMGVGVKTVDQKRAGSIQNPLELYPWHGNRAKIIVIDLPHYIHAG